MVRLEEVIPNLRQMGHELVGWHTVHPSSSKTSLHVDPQKQLWHCFHCGWGGDIYDWVGYAKFGEFYDKRKHFREVKSLVDNGDIPTIPAPTFRALPKTPPENVNLSVYLDYHQAVQRDYWYSELGENERVDKAIDYFKLGYCDSCPTAGVPSHTIPVFEGGKCVNIRHRLVGRSKDKYRPHARGLGSQIFNGDCLHSARLAGRILILAGEKKVISAWANGIYEAISSTIGCNFKEEFDQSLQGIDRRYILFDPGEETAAEALAGRLGARVIEFDKKLDDFFRDGGTRDEVLRKIRSVQSEYWSSKLNIPMPNVK